VQNFFKKHPNEYFKQIVIIYEIPNDM